MYSRFVTFTIAVLCTSIACAQDEFCTPEADGTPCTPVSLFQEKTLLSRNSNTHLQQEASEAVLEVSTTGEKEYDMWEMMDPDRYSLHKCIWKLSHKGPPKQLKEITDENLKSLIDKFTEIDAETEPNGATEEDARLLLPAMAAHISVERALGILRSVKAGKLDFSMVTKYIFAAIDANITFDEANATSQAFETAVSPMTEMDEFEGVFDKAMGYGHKDGPVEDEVKPKIYAMLEQVKAGKKDFEILKLMVMAVKVMQWDEVVKVMKKVENGQEDMARVEIYIHEALEQGKTYSEIFHKHHKKKDPQHSKWGPTIIICVVCSGLLFLLYLMMYRKL